MKKTIIILSVLTLFSNSCIHTTYAQTENESSMQHLINILNESGATFTTDTAADGAIMLEIIKSPHLPTAPPQIKTLHIPTRRRGPIPTIFIILIVLICVPVIFIINRDAKKTQKKYIERLQLFKQQAYKIPVDLADCKIKQKTRYEKTGKAYAFNPQIFNIRRPDIKELHSCTIMYETTINGKSEIFYADVEKDEVTLRMEFYRQKTTYIYLDTQDIYEETEDTEYIYEDTEDTKNYYFDLEFLKSEE